MKKFYYNQNGFICDLYPYIPVTNDCVEFEVSDEQYMELTVVPKYHAWKVISGECVCVDIRTVQEKEEAILYDLRKMRENECFPVVNRGQVWYDTLDIYQKEILRIWYLAWLNVTETRVIPEKPNWLK